MPMQANPKAKVDESMDHSLVHIVVRSWFPYDAVVPNSHGHSGLRVCKQLLRYSERRSVDLPDSAETVVPVPRRESDDDKPKPWILESDKVMAALRQRDWI